MEKKKERVLVIRLGALGDLVLCMGAFAAIRAKHPDAEIALLTGAGFVAFGLSMPWFDHVLIDPRPKITQPFSWIRLIRQVRTYAPTRVYDFQGKLRQSILYYALGGLWGKPPEWSGAVKGCSHPRLWPPQPNMHYTDFLAGQLERAGLAMQKEPDLSWLSDSVDSLSLPKKYALIIPGCAPTRPEKRWPAAHYAELSRRLAAQGLETLAIGTKHDADSIAEICVLAPDVLSLVGKTSLKQVATLARGAQCVVGNDTGPTHLAAAVGARTVALMSGQVDPYWSSPRGSQTMWLQGSPLESLSVDKVWERLGYPPSV